MRFDDWLAKKMEEPCFRAAMEHMAPYRTVARACLDYRINKHWTTKEFARMIGASTRQYQRIEEMLPARLKPESWVRLTSMLLEEAQRDR